MKMTINVYFCKRIDENNGGNVMDIINDEAIHIAYSFVGLLSITTGAVGERNGGASTHNHRGTSTIVFFKIGTFY